MTDAVGWVSSIILLLTIVAQVRKQWRSRSVGGVSRWLFAGQVAASLGFTIYSFLTANTVFIVTNLMLLVSSIVGFYLYYRNAA